MNERIKELELIVARSFDPIRHYSTEQYTEEFNRRFAEFIIKECIYIVDTSDMSELEGPDPEDVLFVARKHIKQHFGIE